MVIAQAPHRIAPQTRSARDTEIDFVRALCVVAVVLLHSIMVGVTVTDTGPVFANASDGAGWLAPLSWVLQVMPLFFVIGGFSGLIAYRRLRERGGSATEFIAARLHRLLLPAFFTIGIVGATLAALAVAGVPADLVLIAGFRYGQPLWFLGVFLLCQTLLPLLAAAHQRTPLRMISGLVAAAVVVDVIRAVTGIDGIGFVNLAFVWMALQQLGFFFADGRIDRLSPRTRLTVGVVAVAALVVTFASGVYSPDLIANINPPTAALLLVGVAHTSALSLLRPHLEAFSRRPRPAAFTAFVTRRTMTIYLWHMPVLLAMAGLSAAFALAAGTTLPAPSSVEWWIGRPLWLITALALTAAVSLLFAKIETARMPVATESRSRIAVAAFTGLLAIVMLLVLGTTALTATAAVLMILTALRLAQPRPVPQLGHGIGHQLSVASAA